MPLPKAILLLILIFSSNSLFAQKDYDPNRKYSITQLKEDFSILHSAFYQEHPGWAVYHPEDSMNAWFAATEAQIDRPMTEKEFRKILFPLIAKLGCGHTRVEPPFAYYKYTKSLRKAETVHHLLPFQTRKFGDRLLVLYNHLSDSTQLLPGTEILEINGRNAARIISDIQSMYPSDGYNLSHRERLINRSFDYTYLFYYGEQKTYDLSIRKLDGTVAQIQLPARSVTSAKYNKVQQQRNKKFIPKDRVIYHKKGYQLRLLKDQENIAILRIKHFDGKRGVRFYKKVFRYLDEKQISNLVIDLRDNGGGAGKEAMTLISYFRNDEVDLFGKKKKKKPLASKHLTGKFGRSVLFPLFMPIFFKAFKDSTHLHMGFSKKPRKKNQFTGRSMLLSNGLTFSSSAIVGAYLKDADKVTIIGQESGGGATSTNAFQMPRLVLPNSKTKIKYPLFRLEFSIDTKEQGQGLIPDYPVAYSLEDVLEGKDLEMEVVKKLYSPSEK